MRTLLVALTLCLVPWADAADDGADRVSDPPFVGDTGPGVPIPDVLTLRQLRALAGLFHTAIYQLSDVLHGRVTEIDTLLVHAADFCTFEPARKSDPVSDPRFYDIQTDLTPQEYLGPEDGRLRAQLIPELYAVINGFDRADRLAMLAQLGYLRISRLGWRDLMCHCGPVIGADLRGLAAQGTEQVASYLQRASRFTRVYDVDLLEAALKADVAIADSVATNLLQTASAADLPNLIAFFVLSRYRQQVSVSWSVLEPFVSQVVAAQGPDTFTAALNARILSLQDRLNAHDPSLFTTDFDCDTVLLCALYGCSQRHLFNDPQRSPLYRISALITDPRVVEQCRDRGVLARVSPYLAVMARNTDRDVLLRFRPIDRRPVPGGLLSQLSWRLCPALYESAEFRDFLAAVARTALPTFQHRKQVAYEASCYGNEAPTEDSEPISFFILLSGLNVEDIVRLIIFVQNNLLDPDAVLHKDLEDAVNASEAFHFLLHRDVIEFTVRHGMNTEIIRGIFDANIWGDHPGDLLVRIWWSLAESCYDLAWVDFAADAPAKFRKLVEFSRTESDQRVVYSVLSRLCVGQLKAVLLQPLEMSPVFRWRPKPARPIEELFKQITDDRSVFDKWHLRLAAMHFMPEPDWNSLFLEQYESDFRSGALTHIDLLTIIQQLTPPY